MAVTFEPLSERHLSSVWHIEKLAHTHPWAKKSIYDLGNRFQCHHVMLLDGQVVGYFYAQNVVGEVSLLNIAVSPEYQGQRLGLQLAEFFCAYCQSQQAESIWLEVRESNYRAIKLYHKLGFSDVDTRPHYYPVAGGREDAVIMSYYLAD